MKKVLIGLSIFVVLTILLIAVVLYFNSNKSDKKVTDTANPTSNSTQENVEPVVPENQKFTQETFQNIKTPHYVSSSPANNELLTSSPSQVVITFNFDLANNPTIQVTRDGVSAVAGEKQISTDKLNLSIPINATQTGNYRVEYSACWPDGSCHQGSFGFSVKL